MDAAGLGWATLPPDTEHPPVATCYISETGEFWLLVDQTPPLMDPPLVGCTIQTHTDRSFTIQVYNAPPSWFYYIVYVY